MKHVSHISLVFGSPSKQVWTSVLQCFVTLLQLLQRPCRMRQWRVLCSRREDKLRIPNGWLCHLAPELIQQLSSDTEEDKLPFSKQSDVFAFGWVSFYFLQDVWRLNKDGISFYWSIVMSSILYTIDFHPLISARITFKNIYREITVICTSVLCQQKSPTVIGYSGPCSPVFNKAG